MHCLHCLHGDSLTLISQIEREIAEDRKCIATKVDYALHFGKKKTISQICVRYCMFFFSLIFKDIYS